MSVLTHPARTTMPVKSSAGNGYETTKSTTTPNQKSTKNSCSMSFSELGEREESLTDEKLKNCACRKLHLPKTAPQHCKSRLKGTASHCRQPFCIAYA